MKPLFEIVYQDDNGAIVHDKIEWYPEITVADVLKMPKYVHLTGRKVGVFSKIVTYDYYLSKDDRLEFYLPLIIDPKDARRLRAKTGKSS